MHRSMLHHNLTILWTLPCYTNEVLQNLRWKTFHIMYYNNRNRPFITLRVGLFFDFFWGDIFGQFGPPDFVSSLYQADKVRILHGFFFTLSFTTSSKSPWQNSTKMCHTPHVTLWHTWIKHEDSKRLINALKIWNLCTFVAKHQT